MARDSGRFKRYFNQRYLGFPETEHFADLTLICFCDASVEAYATAIYLHHSSLGAYKTDLIFFQKLRTSFFISVNWLVINIGKGFAVCIQCSTHWESVHRNFEVTDK